MTHISLNLQAIVRFYYSNEGLTFAKFFVRDFGLNYFLC